MSGPFTQGAWIETRRTSHVTCPVCKAKSRHPCTDEHGTCATHPQRIAAEAELDAVAAAQNGEARGWLAEARADRYSSDEKDWQEPVIDKAVAKVREYKNVAEAMRDYATKRVRQREGTATRRVNKILRDIDSSLFGWADGDNWKSFLFDLLRLPMSVNRQRVCFGAASGEDLKEWLEESKREEEKRKAAEASSRSGAILLMEWMSAQGAHRIDDLRPASGAS